jgi:peptide/nickel transport system ATP-binding protein/oligopeptide transport system ATP-binding protein
MNKLVEVNNLKIYFSSSRKLSKEKDVVKAVDDITFDIRKGEIMGLVGESGCGKTTCGKAILRLLEPIDGSIFFDGHDITHLKRKEMTPFRKRMMLIYQDPYGSLDPRMTVGATIAEPMMIHRIVPSNQKEDKVIELMRKVGLTANQINRYPHEFSGGQRQRIGIARALATNSEFIVADEPVSALDVSIQAQIINLLKDLCDEFQLTLLFIAHDLSVIKHMCDRVAVMYLGKIVEIASKKDLFSDPLHPYTQALLSAIPAQYPEQRGKKTLLTGDVPSPVNPPAGCRFHTRCTQCMPQCSQNYPELIEVSEEHFVACHLLH